MKKRQLLLFLVLAASVGFFFYIHDDWFSGNKIRINHRDSPARVIAPRRGRASGGDAASLFFSFDRKLKLDLIRVVSVNELKTNKYAHPVWEMISDSNSVPTAGFIYGMNV